MIVSALEAGYVATPLVCWLLMRRTLRTGVVVVVLLGLCALAVVAVGAGWVDTRARAEVFVGYPPAVVLLVAGGALAERRALGRRPKRPWADRASVSVVAMWCYALLVGLIAVPCYLVFGVTEAFAPRVGDVPVLSGTSVRSTGGGCGSGVCFSGVTVRSATGEPVNQLAARLRTALVDRRGWRLDDQGQGCRRNGWLLDRRQECVTVLVDGGAVDVALEGGDVWH